MISNDARAQMMYDARKKSVFLTYVLWFFLWGVSMHRLYVHKWFSAFVQFMLGVAGFALIMIGVVPGGPSIIILGWGLLALWGLSFFIDLFRIPSWVHRYNMNIVDRM